MLQINFLGAHLNLKNEMTTVSNWLWLLIFSKVFFVQKYLCNIFFILLKFLKKEQIIYPVIFMYTRLTVNSTSSTFSEICHQNFKDSSHRYYYLPIILLISYLPCSVKQKFSEQIFSIELTQVRNKIAWEIILINILNRCSYFNKSLKNSLRNFTGLIIWLIGGIINGGLTSTKV